MNEAVYISIEFDVLKASATTVGCLTVTHERTTRKPWEKGPRTASSAPSELTVVHWPLLSGLNSISAGKPLRYMKLYYISTLRIDFNLIKKDYSIDSFITTITNIRRVIFRLTMYLRPDFNSVVNLVFSISPKISKYFASILSDFTVHGLH